MNERKARPGSKEEPPLPGSLPHGFRRRELEERRTNVQGAFAIEKDGWDALSGLPLQRELADVMVESAVGCMPVPLGLATGFLIDGADVTIPLAVEEPSIIAAATFAARLIRRDGGFVTWASAPLMTAQVFLESVSAEGLARLQRLRRARGSLPLPRPCKPCGPGRGFPAFRGVAPARDRHRARGHRHRRAGCDGSQQAQHRRRARAAAPGRGKRRTRGDGDTQQRGARPARRGAIRHPLPPARCPVFPPARIRPRRRAASLLPRQSRRRTLPARSRTTRAS